VSEDRRTVLKLISGIAGGGAAAAICGPAARALLAPVTLDTVRGAGDYVPVADLEVVPEDGTPARVAVVVEAPIDGWAKLPPTEVGAVFLRRPTPGAAEVVAFSTVCPHLGCGVDFDRARGAYRCPCHDSAFSPGGEVSGGPSPRGLDQLETRVRDGKVEVRYLRFTIGTAEKIPA
jgi:Rieske Fe-S protein